MESVQAALGKGFVIAARLGLRVFRTAVFNALFLLSEEDLELGIEQEVDLLGLFLIYAPQHVKIARQFAGRAGRGFEKKLTLENALRWVKEECDRKKTRHYDVIVNLPEGCQSWIVHLARGLRKKKFRRKLKETEAPSKLVSQKIRELRESYTAMSSEERTKLAKGRGNMKTVRELMGEPIPDGVYLPPGADMKRVNWFWGNCQRLLKFTFYGKVPKATKQWGVDHLRWLAAREKEGKTKLKELLEEGHKQVRESKTK